MKQKKTFNRMEVEEFELRFSCQQISSRGKNTRRNKGAKVYFCVSLRRYYQRDVSCIYYLLRSMVYVGKRDTKGIKDPGDGNISVRRKSQLLLFETFISESEEKEQLFNTE